MTVVSWPEEEWTQSDFASATTTAKGPSSCNKNGKDATAADSLSLPSASSSITTAASSMTPSSSGRVASNSMTTTTTPSVPCKQQSSKQDDNNDNTDKNNNNKKIYVEFHEIDHDRDVLIDKICFTPHRNIYKRVVEECAFTYSFAKRNEKSKVLDKIHARMIQERVRFLDVDDSLESNKSRFFVVTHKNKIQKRIQSCVREFVKKNWPPQQASIISNASSSAAARSKNSSNDVASSSTSISIVSDLSVGPAFPVKEVSLIMSLPNPPQPQSEPAATAADKKAATKTMLPRVSTAGTTLTALTTASTDDDISSIHHRQEGAVPAEALTKAEMNQGEENSVEFAAAPTTPRTVPPSPPPSSAATQTSIVTEPSSMEEEDHQFMTPVPYEYSGGSEGDDHYDNTIMTENTWEDLINFAPELQDMVQDTTTESEENNNSPPTKHAQDGGEVAMMIESAALNAFPESEFAPVPAPISHPGSSIVLPTVPAMLDDASSSSASSSPPNWWRTLSRQLEMVQKQMEYLRQDNQQLRERVFFCEGQLREASSPSISLGNSNVYDICSSNYHYFGNNNDDEYDTSFAPAFFDTLDSCW